MGLSIDLNGRVVLVLGGARGIGASCVRLAAACGARVAWTYLDTERDRVAAEELAADVTGQGGQCLHAPVDATDAAGVAQFVGQVHERWGRLDSLIYCAGFTSPLSFLEISAEEWRRLVDINLNGAFYATRAAIPLMQAAGGGSIVLIGSAAIVAGGGGRADYVSAKSGLEGLSRAITKQFAPAGIRCNIVHPSLIETDLLRERHPDPEKRRQVGSEVPLGRLGQPEDIAQAALFLLSDLASYITAQSLYVDGGRTFCK